ncbi:phosphotransferase [Micromonospora sp. WMMD718]|uniref:phosphotransferase enzyme family protein n=1 Tax=Micromonospora sp. WMMD718 TaxID=3016098 RepID=UPI0024163333|nr:phosphotransferase [Micromonospora sp. WMMD718]MDG4756263.1 phosphotransferase [Micromonospora sp. WMMD718]
MLRLGSNAIFRLGGAVIRVARGLSGPEVAAREVQVANALIAAGVPCVPPWPVSQPLMIDGHPVTLWFEIPAPLEQPSMAEFGTIIRQLHEVGGDLGLSPLDPWERTPERVEQAPVREQDRRVLRAVLAEVQDRWGNTEFELAPGVIHGDAHAGNVVRGSDGATVLIDFESACVGPREWDLAPMGLYVTTLGWISKRQYTTFVDAYGGFDVTTAPAFDLLRRMRELRMTAWLAMHSTESAETAAEVEHRVACLADPDLPRHWSAR